MQDRKGALDFFQRKIEYVTKSMEGVQQALKEKDVMRDRKSGEKSVARQAVVYLGVASTVYC